MPPSSDDLVVELLREMRNETRDGFKTLHGKFDRLDQRAIEHAEHDANQFQTLTHRDAQLAERLARLETNDERDAEDRKDRAVITGRFNLEQIAQQAAASAGKRHSTPSPVMAFITKAASSTAGKVGAVVGGAIGAMVAGAVVSHATFGFAGETKTETRTVYIPVPVASAPEPALAVTPPVDAGLRSAPASVTASPPTRPR